MDINNSTPYMLLGSETDLDEPAVEKQSGQERSHDYFTEAPKELLVRDMERLHELRCKIGKFLIDLKRQKDQMINRQTGQMIDRNLKAEESILCLGFPEEIDQVFLDGSAWKPFLKTIEFNDEDRHAVSNSQVDTPDIILAKIDDCWSQMVYFKSRYKGTLKLLHEHPNLLNDPVIEKAMSEWSVVESDIEQLDKPLYYYKDFAEERLLAYRQTQLNNEPDDSTHDMLAEAVTVQEEPTEERQSIMNRLFSCFHINRSAPVASENVKSDKKPTAKKRSWWSRLRDGWNRLRDDYFPDDPQDELLKFHCAELYKTVHQISKCLIDLRKQQATLINGNEHISLVRFSEKLDQVFSDGSALQPILLADGFNPQDQYTEADSQAYTPDDILTTIDKCRGYIEEFQSKYAEAQDVINKDRSILNKTKIKDIMSAWSNVKPDVQKLALLLWDYKCVINEPLLKRELDQLNNKSDRIADTDEQSNQQTLKASSNIITKKPIVNFHSHQLANASVDNSVLPVQQEFKQCLSHSIREAEPTHKSSDLQTPDYTAQNDAQTNLATSATTDVPSSAVFNIQNNTTTNALNELGTMYEATLQMRHSEEPNIEFDIPSNGSMDSTIKRPSRTMSSQTLALDGDVLVNPDKRRFSI